MKRLFLIIPISFCLALPACKKAAGPANLKSVQPNNNLDSTVLMTATINGQSWRAYSAFGYYVLNSGNDTGTKNLLITATQNNTNPATTITFNIYNYTGPSTYQIDPPVNTAAYYVGNLRHFGNSGHITISSDSAYALKGNFSFIAGTDTITSGVFNVALP